MRLSKYLAQAGIASRRKAEQIIQAGEVKVNGTVIQELGTRIDPQLDVVEYNHIKLLPEKQLYFLLNKPAGFLSSVGDTRGRKTVIDLLYGVTERVYPVGRLDYDTEGLLLLSNDGEFTNCMIHPRYKIEKSYEAMVRGQVSDEAVLKLKQGVNLEDGLTSPAQVRLLKMQPSRSLLEIIIHEGKKRQVKRMCEAVGHPVIKLRRTGFAFLTLNGVTTGNYRPLSAQEVQRLYEMAGGMHFDDEGQV